MCGLGARPRILRHVAQGSSAQHDPARSVVVPGQDLQQACLARAVAADEADLVPRGNGEARVGQHSARCDVDGETSGLDHERQLLRDGLPDVL